MRYLILIYIVVFILFTQDSTADWLTDPSVFEPLYYADHNKDVYEKDGYDKAKLISHWRSNGIREGRGSSPVFDVRYYLKQNSDVARVLGKNNFPQATKHWYDTGRKEGRPSHPKFHVKIYLEKNPELVLEFGKRNYVRAIDHYLNIGYEKGLLAR